LFGSDESGQEQKGVNMEQIIEIAKKLLSGKKKKRPIVREVVEEEEEEGEKLSSAIARQLRRR
jgi:hypothetical protein